MSNDLEFPEGITLEILMAYADGALNADDTAKVKAAIEAHPSLAEEVALFQSSRSVLDGVFDAPMHEPVPDQLSALFMEPAKDIDTENVTSLHAARVKRSIYGSPIGQAIAACAVFAVGLFTGTALLDKGPSMQSNDSELLLAGRLDAKHPIAMALENTGSAKLVEFGGGQFDAVATFLTEGDVPCREFEAADTTGAMIGVACRRDDSWSVELLLAASPGVAPESGFQLASAFDSDVLDRVLNDLGASTGLSAGGEFCLIENDWDPAECKSE